MNTWKQNIVPPKSLKVNLSLQMIPNISIPIKAWEEKRREKEKQEQYTTEFLKLFHFYREEKFVH